MDSAFPAAPAETAAGRGARCGVCDEPLATGYAEVEPAVVAAEPDVLEPDVLELELDESLELEDEAPLVELLLDETR